MTDNAHHWRRSIAPGAPPPAHPPPNIPSLAFDHHPPSSPPQSFARPSASAGLAAVAAYQQTRQASTSSTIHDFPSDFPSVGSLSDDPPHSLLPPSTVPAPSTQDVFARNLLVPQDQNPRLHSSSGSRPSSRRALTRALELARQAVQLDSTNNDPIAAIQAYGMAVALLKEVMERVMRGEDSTERRRTGRRRSVVAQQEEVQRLKSIHDTYSDRMNILSMICNIPSASPSLSQTSLYGSSLSASTTDVSRTSSPYRDPSSDRSETSRQPSSNLPSDVSEDEYSDQPDDYVIDGGYSSESTRSAPYVPPSYAQPPSPHRTLATRTASPSHPYANPDGSPEIRPTQSRILAARTSAIPAARPPPSGSIPARPRASSTLPPPAPPPSNAPPPAPSIPTDDQHAAQAQHGRTSSISQPVGENGGAYPQTAAVNRTEFPQDTRRPRSKSVSGRHPASRDLPPIPGTATSPVTPRNPEHQHEPGSSASSSTFITPRPRDAVEPVAQIDGLPQYGQGPLIMTTTNQGTISQRRQKVSTEPAYANGSVSPTDSNSSGSSIMSRINSGSGLPLPANQVASLQLRTRSSSQPASAWRPSGSPPLGAANGQNGLQPRKSSVPSRLNPNPLSIMTGRLSPGMLTPLSLVPPPPLAPEDLPTTPTSPLPPAPPSEASRKPYHLMALLRQTMTSRTGGYITPRLHVPQEVWSQGGAKLANVSEKARVVDLLCSELDVVTQKGKEIFGGSVNWPGSVAIAEKDGVEWGKQLEDFITACDGCVAQMGKKLGVGESIVNNKKGMGSWGGKLTRQFDKLTNTKNLDSPAAYVQGLSRLFLLIDILDDHTKALSAQPVAAAYALLPMDARNALQTKLKHISEFFASVVLTFVIRDLSLLLDKYAKKCEKWLAE